MLKKDDFLIRLAKSVDELRKEFNTFRNEIKTPLVEKEAQLTVSSIWSTAPTEEQKITLHNNIAQLMKINGIRQATIQYGKTN